MILHLWLLFSLSFSLSLEEKVGQLFIVGVEGKQLRPSTIQKIKDIKPGGIILFRHNLSLPYETYLFNQSLQNIAVKNSLPPFLIGIDQEGGVVSRIPTSPRAPSAAVVGRQQDQNKIFRYGKALGELLQVYGFNMNFAPVLDQTTHSYSDFIGTRSFSYNLDRIILSSSSFAKGLKASAIATVGKHFPGHGRISTDSHKALPSLPLAAEDLEQTSARPFIELYKRNLLDAVMVGHLSFPKIDPLNLPATFSRPLLHGLLRERMGFQGLIITDDIEMKAAGITNDAGERAVLAIEAGVDMIMVAWNPKSQIKAYNGVLQAVRSGRISEERIRQSYERIKKIKSLTSSPRKFSSKESFNAALKQIPWATSVYAVRDKSVDLKVLKTKVALNKSQQTIIASADHDFLKSSGIEKSILLNHSQQTDQIEQLLTGDAILIFHSTSPKTFNLLQSISPKLKERIIVINSSRPTVVEETYLHVINLLERSPFVENTIIKEIKNLRAPASAEINLK